MALEQARLDIYKSVFGDETYNRLLIFEEQLIKWNRKFSLTSVPDNEIFNKLIAPSAWLGMEYGKEKIGTLADFGCGPGIPGAVMAIVDRNNRYALYDSNTKKIGFINHCISIRGLFADANAKTFEIRLLPDSDIEPVDRLVTRAAGDMVNVIRLWQGKVRTDGVADFFKGDDAEEEIDRLLKAYPSGSYQIIDSPDWFGKLKIVRIIGIFKGL